MMIRELSLIVNGKTTTNQASVDQRLKVAAAINRYTISHITYSGFQHKFDTYLKTLYNKTDMFMKTVKRFQKEKLISLCNNVPHDPWITTYCFGALPFLLLTKLVEAFNHNTI